MMVCGDSLCWYMELALQVCGGSGVGLFVMVLSVVCDATVHDVVAMVTVVTVCVGTVLK